MPACVFRGQMTPQNDIERQFKAIAALSSVPNLMHEEYSGPSHKMMSLRIFLLSLALVASVIGVKYHPYDKFNGIFSPDGSLLQLEYAKKASSQGSTVVCGLSCVEENKAIVCFPETANQLSLIDPRHLLEKLTKIDDSSIMICSGLACDAQYLVDQTRRFWLQQYAGRGTAPRIRAVANALAELFHGRSLDPRTRPLAVNVILIGWNSVSRKMELLALDPSGQIHSCIGHCIGKDSNSLRRKIETRWRPSWRINDWKNTIREIDEYESSDGWSDSPLAEKRSSVLFEIHEEDGKLRIHPQE